MADALAPGSAEVSVDPVPVPLDCTDGFEAFYGRPEAFLRPEIRAATSGLTLTDPAALRRQAERVGAFRLVTART